MRLLLDTNIFLEILLDQVQATACRRLLSKTAEYRLFISDFSLHSIGIILFRRNQYQVFEEFWVDVLLNAKVGMLALPGDVMNHLVQVAQRFSLDFDDAYQYALAEYYGLSLVSLDADFDRTECGRKTPTQLT
ncbi:MAG: PIN domain-containing protein [Anaerolineae bacterium]|jgi:predicted nucleic acid-binding protein|nr:PIN domain-containing protein [Anaerolineae bacterium]